eukprot:Amastigsp_a1137_20.p6 type:complete len:172 gc:universal Amastigsp_a1137_20:2006-2521(+)
MQRKKKPDGERSRRVEQPREQRRGVESHVRRRRARDRRSEVQQRRDKPRGTDVEHERSAERHRARGAVERKRENRVAADNETGHGDRNKSLGVRRHPTRASRPCERTRHRERQRQRAAGHQEKRDRARGGPDVGGVAQIVERIDWLARRVRCALQERVRKGESECDRGASV